MRIKKLTSESAPHPLKPEIEAVIFDIGGVFIGLDFSRAVMRTATALNRPPKDVMLRLFGTGDPMTHNRHAYMNDYECGRMNDLEFHARVEELLGEPFAFDDFKAAWNDIFLSPLHDTVKMADALHARGEVKLGILSNNNAMHWAAIQPVLPSLKKFQNVFLSHEIGLKKPHAEAFQHALNTMAVDPARTIFVDDLKENIATAHGLGMKTIHAINSRAVHLGFHAFGLNVELP